MRITARTMHAMKTWQVWIEPIIQSPQSRPARSFDANHRESTPDFRVIVCELLEADWVAPQHLAHMLTHLA